MQDRKAAVLSAAGYAAFFTLFMIWWTGSRDAASIAMLTLCGTINGIIWYWLFHKGTRWAIGRRDLRPRP